MGPASRRERERLALRTKIMDAARRLFAENGYEAVTIRSIAEAIEYSPRTIYLHFKDKEALFRQLCIEDFELFGRGMAQFLATEDPLERLLLLGRSYAEFAVSHPHHYRLMFMSPPAAPPDDETTCNKGNPEADAYALLVATVKECMDKGYFHPEYQDPDLLAQLLWASRHGVVSQHLMLSGEGYIPWRPLAERIEGIARITLHGIVRPDGPAGTRSEPAKPQSAPKSKKK
jgi:AcrR family transcriptional regulator